MCGIWGHVGRTESIPVADAWTGLRSLTDRGPDDWGMYVEGERKIKAEEDLPDGDRRVAIGNRRLSIIDLSSAGNQPLCTDAGHWIVYNGEVYNYRELRSNLEDRGHAFTSDTDTEVVLRAYEEYGESCVERFRGMFAFAIYDESTDEVFAARDRFGIKPFYYDLNDQRFAFASEVTALLDGNISKPELDPESVDGFLTFGYVPEPRTIVEGVRSLPPGSTLVYEPDTGDCAIERYWTPSFDDGDPGDAGRIRELLRESVELRLRSDVPVGAFLSGGLDSSTVVALMQEVAEPGGGDIHTFSIGFDNEEYSETKFAETVAEALGTDHTSRTVTAPDIVEEIDDIVDAMDQPTIDGVNTYFVSKVAGNAGLKVALSGLGSDEILFGYPTFERVARWYPAAKFLYRVPRPIRDPLAAAVDSLGTVLPGPPTSKIADAIRGDHPFGSAYVTARGLFTRRQRQELLGPTTDWEGRIERSVSRTISNAGVHDAVSHAELAWYMCDQLLRDTDAMSMSHSLEIRVPFLDREFAQYVMDAGVDSKQRGEKALLKDAIKDAVPVEIIDREKSGFTFPFGDWMRGDLHPVVERAFTDGLLEETPLNPEAAEEIRQSFYRRTEHWSRLWAIVVLSLWVEKHVLDRERHS